MARSGINAGRIGSATDLVAGSLWVRPTSGGSVVAVREEEVVSTLQGVEAGSTMRPTILPMLAKLCAR